MKLCLHKGAAWCEMCRVFHCNPFTEITTFSSPSREYLCNLCSGFKFDPLPDADDIVYYVD